MPADREPSRPWAAWRWYALAAAILLALLIVDLAGLADPLGR